MDLNQQIQSVMAGHRLDWQADGQRVECSCGRHWPAEDALPAWSQHVGVVLTKELTAPPEDQPDPALAQAFDAFAQAWTERPESLGDYWGEAL